MDANLISIIVFVGVMGLVGAIGFALRDFRPSKAEDRLEVITGKKSATPEKETQSVVKQEMISENLTGLASMVTGVADRLAQVRMWFEQANSPITADVFVILTLVLAALGMAGAVFARSPVPLYPVAAIFAGSCPTIWLFFRRKGRFDKFANQLPAALELIARALRSGHSLNSGLHVVVEEMPDPISSEFGIAYEEQNLGVPIEIALKNMLHRMPNLDLKFFVTAVAIQRQSGGDLAEILDKLGHIIRERFKIIGQVKALTGEGRISGVILMALPIVLFIATYQMNPEYVMLLFQSELGRKMTAGAVVMQIFGAIAIKKIVNIKI